MTSYTPSLDSPVWKYWVGSFAPYEIVWGPDGRIQEIRGEAIVRARVTYLPGKQAARIT